VDRQLLTLTGYTMTQVLDTVSFDGNGRDFLEALRLKVLAVLGNPLLSQEPVHPQPSRPLRGGFEVMHVTAPGKAFQRLLWPQSNGLRRLDKCRPVGPRD
jgi:hypothetical protein